MGLLDCASGASVWRGYNYYKDKKVLELKRNSETSFSAAVAGNAAEPYHVEIDTEHPRSSRCNCPHAEGTRIVCKHMVAVYFTAFPKEAKQFYDDAAAYQKEEEQRQEELADSLIAYVHKMKKSDLCEALLQILFDGPEWQYDSFIRDYLYDEDDWD